MSTPSGRLTGDEPIRFGPILEDAVRRPTVREWWSWSFSNVLDDGIRGCLAEYLVAKLLGASDQKFKGWPYDFTLSDGVTRVEVKSSAYHQAWEKNRLTPICFSVPRSRLMIPGEGFENEARRHADLFVFCALIERKRSRVDPFDLSQWWFFPALAHTVDELAGSRNVISLRKLEERVGAAEAADLRRRVDELRPQRR